jgi:Putative prokaryotic signal transducing protein
MKDYQVIAVFTYPSEYTVLQHLLQQADIRFVFQNETMISVLPFHSNAIGGIRLMVHHEDASDALEILNNLNNPSSLRIV